MAFSGYSIPENESIYNLKACYLIFSGKLSTVPKDAFVITNNETKVSTGLLCKKIYNTDTDESYITFSAMILESGRYTIRKKDDITLTDESGSTIEIAYPIIFSFGEEKKQTPEYVVIDDNVVAQSVQPKPISTPISRKARTAEEPVAMPLPVDTPDTISSVAVEIEETVVQKEEPVLYNALDELSKRPAAADIQNVTTEDDQSYAVTSVDNVVRFHFAKKVLHYSEPIIGLNALNERLSTKFKYVWRIIDGDLELEIEEPPVDLLVSVLFNPRSIQFQDLSYLPVLTPMYALFNARQDYISFFAIYASTFHTVDIDLNMYKSVILVLQMIENVAPLHQLRPADIVETFMCVVQAWNSPFKYGGFGKSVVYTEKYLESAAIGALSASWHMLPIGEYIMKYSGPSLTRFDYRNCFLLIEGHDYLDSKNIVGTQFAGLFVQETVSEQQRYEASEDIAEARWGKGWNAKWRS